MVFIKKSKISFYLFLFITIMVIIFLFNQNSRLNSGINKIQLEKNQLQQQKQDLQKQLGTASEEIEDYEETVEDLEEKYTKSEEKLEKTKKEIVNIKAEIDQFEDKVKESMSWFKNNSNIAFHKEYDDIADDVIDYCTSTGTGNCKIILSCLPFVNLDRNGIIYRFDEETSLKEDALQSLNQIYKNQGGDCEDVSLLAVAELNYIMSYCKENGADKPQFFAFVPEFDSYLKYSNRDKDDWGSFYYVTKELDWGYRNAKEHKIPKDYQHYYVVCGLFYEESENYEGLASFFGNGVLMDTGHCLLAFTTLPIESVDDIKKALEDSILVEPQTGMKYSQDTPKLLDSETSYEDTYISHVITENDLYQIYESDDGDTYWKSYEGFLNNIEGVKEIISNIDIS